MKTKRTPVDYRRCQAVVPNGANAFTVGGVPGRARCTCKPKYAVRELHKADDGFYGGMSLCQSCFDAFKKTVDIGDYAVTEIQEYEQSTSLGFGLDIEFLADALQGVLERGNHLTGNFRIVNNTLLFEIAKGVPHA